MDDAGALGVDLALQGREAAPTMVKQGIHQGAGGVACAGMNHQSDRLVDDDEVLVLVKHVEVDGLGDRCLRAVSGLLGLDRRQVQGDAFAAVSG